MELDGEKKVGALLETVDELVKIAPELVPGANFAKTSTVVHTKILPSVHFRFLIFDKISTDKQHFIITESEQTHAK